MASPNAPKTAKAVLLRGRILELRVLGLTLEEIGRHPDVGLVKSNVKKHLDRALVEAQDATDLAATRYKSLAYQRLERLLKKSMLLAAGGNIKAMETSLKLIMGQARIMGFDAPVKHTQTDPSGEFERPPPGAYQLPTRPDCTIQEWQTEAARVWLEQQQREANSPA